MGVCWETQMADEHRDVVFVTVDVTVNTEAAAEMCQVRAQASFSFVAFSCHTERDREIKGGLYVPPRPPFFPPLVEIQISQNGPEQCREAVGK